MTTEILALDELSSSQSSKEVTHNTALRQLEGKVVRALDKDLTAAPGSPVNGDVYIVASGATGAWSGKDGKIAHFWGGAWKYYTPVHGNSLFVTDEDRRYFFNGTNWAKEPAGPIPDGDYGDVVVSSTGTVFTIDNGVVTYAKMQDVSATSRLLGRVTAGSGDVEEVILDSDGTMAANSASRVPTQSAIVTYVDSRITGGSSDVMIFKGVIDCSANPNYPAADAGNVYKVSVAGKIGGASGPNVEAGDTLYCTTDSTASGNHATVGANWVIAQVNIDGSVTGPSSATDNHVAFFDGSTGKIIKDSGLTLSGTNTGDETTTTAGALINGATAKTTPVDADYVGLMDSAASNVLKKLSWANIKATLKTYFDTLYAPLTQPFCLAMTYPGSPTASGLVGVLAAPAGISTITFAAAMSGSSGKALTAATAQTDLDVRKNATTNANGTSVGTIRFAASGTVPTFIAASGFTLTGGTDYLSIWFPASVDATLANISFTLYATR